jgi:hypothetical protein
MVGLFSDFEVVEPQVDFIEEPYDIIEKNSHGYLLFSPYIA